MNSLMINGTLDYCNSVLYGLPAITLAPLRRVLYAAVRLVANLCYRDRDASNERASLATNRLPRQIQIMSHDARGSKQQKPGIYYRYTRPDIISASP